MVRHIVIVLLKDGTFDCVLDDALYLTRTRAELAIQEVVAEDKAREWAYQYRIFTVRAK